MRLSHHPIPHSVPPSNGGAHELELENRAVVVVPGWDWLDRRSWRRSGHLSDPRRNTGDRSNPPLVGRDDRRRIAARTEAHTGRLFRAALFAANQPALTAHATVALWDSRHSSASNSQNSDSGCELPLDNSLRAHIRAPSKLTDSFGGLPEVLRLLERMELASMHGSGGLILDMRACTFVSRAACLLLTAQIDRCHARNPGSVGGFNPQSRDVCQRLEEFGFYKHLNFRSPSLPANDDQAPHLKFCSGVGVSEDLSNRLEEVASLARLVFPDKDAVDDVHEALNEAVTNIVGHGYSEEVSPIQTDLMNSRFALQNSQSGGLKALPKPLWHGRWWFAGYANVTRGELQLYALDHGHSIPAIAPITMAQPLVDFWRHQDPTTRVKPENRKAGEILEGVARARRLGLGTGRRGKGFPTMISLVENDGSQGHVRVLSGAALYEFVKPTPHMIGKERAFTMDKSLTGTMIEWRLGLPRYARQRG